MQIEVVAALKKMKRHKALFLNGWNVDGINSRSWSHCLPIGISLIRRGRLYSSCVRSSILHGRETWPARKENEVALQRPEMRMVR